MNVQIVNKRLPLAAQVGPGMILQFKGRTAIAAPRVLQGFSIKLRAVKAD